MIKSLLVASVFSISGNDVEDTNDYMYTVGNNDDEQTDMLVALVDGKEVSIYAESENILVNGDRKLQEGDIIQYKTNSKGEIVSIRLLLDITAKNNEFTLNPTDKLEIVYGKVTKKFSNSVNVSVNNSNTVNYTIPA